MKSADEIRKISKYHKDLEVMKEEAENLIMATAETGRYHTTFNTYHYHMDVINMFTQWLSGLGYRCLYKCSDDCVLIDWEAPEVNDNGYY